MTTHSLRLAMAKLLPEQIDISNDGQGPFYWNYNHAHEILETEWLYVMHLIELSCTEVQLHALDAWHQKQWELDQRGLNYYTYILLLTFEQRAEAMAKVKGLT